MSDRISSVGGARLPEEEGMGEEGECHEWKWLMQWGLHYRTSKMYRGGKICLTIHFKPLWAKNVPHFGIAHAMCLGLAPWMAAEVPHLVESGKVTAKA
jgi:hypothetical protein